MIGEGKYDDLATLVREKARARGVVVLVMGGEEGGGFSVQMNLHDLLTLPGALREIADALENDIPNLRPEDAIPDKEAAPHE